MLSTYSLRVSDNIEIKEKHNIKNVEELISYGLPETNIAGFKYVLQNQQTYIMVEQ